jgi:HlyD family secretion protein
MTQQQKKKTFRKVLYIALPVALVAVLVLGMRPEPVPVILGEVTRGPLTVTLGEEGRTRVRERFVVSAPVAGQVLRVELKPGLAVAAGQVIATLRPSAPGLLDARARAGLTAAVRTATAALGRARADRDRARAELRFAQAERGRTAALGKEGIVSQSSVEVADLGVETRRGLLAAAEYSVTAAEHELEAARAALLEAEGGEAGGAVYEVRSPVAGVVLRRLRESESVVAAGEPLLEIGDPRDLEIVADLLSSDAAQLAPGQRVEIEQWNSREEGEGTGTLAGRVERVEPSGFTKISALGVEEQRVDVVIALDQVPPQLQDGFRVEIRVVLWEGKDVLQVPASGLFRDGGTWWAFVLDGGKARRQEVEVGALNDLQAAVRGGLRPGDRVILHPTAAVADGVKVAERGAAKS